MRISTLITFAAAACLTAAPPAFAQGRGGGHPVTPTVAHGNPHTTPTTSSSPKTTTSTPTTTANPIAVKISSHPELAARLTALLPKGMTLDQASSGFRNQGQFIAAVHASDNLHIPFTQLKALMLGTGGSKPMSLGQAIHTLRPSANEDIETRHATTQASSDLSKSRTTTKTDR
jgi:hypothetical protein